MATMPPPSSFNALASRFVAERLLTDKQAQSAQIAAQRAGQSFIGYLLANELLDSLDIATLASQTLGIPLFDLNSISLDYLATDLLPERLIRQHQALPLSKRGNRLYIAIADPGNVFALDAFQFHTDLQPYPVLVEQQSLQQIIERALDHASDQRDDFGTAVMDDLDLTAADEVVSDNLADSDIDAPPVVRFINTILNRAISAGASDIHFEPYEDFYRVRLRIDGILHQARRVPVALGLRIAARLKVLSRLNIAERRLPQDGRMRMRQNDRRSIDFRVNTCPTLFGEKIVLRLLDPSSAQLDIDVLGFDNNQKATFLHYIYKPYGMILVTGPTGSGKTISLYTALNILNSDDRNISTAEDPVEISLPGINQVTIKPRIDLTFSNALRAFLRQDPDVIMVGEIRDLETAEIVIKAAQTGHMVFSTLHTNDAPQTLTRLVNMGVAPFNIASAVSLIIAQRLVRRLCPHCKQPQEVPMETLRAEGFNQQQIAQDLRLYRATGCDQCTEGYKGRIGIYQMMPVSKAMGQIIMNGGNSLQLAEQARAEGIDDLRAAGLKKVAAGITSLDEINRVIRE